RAQAPRGQARRGRALPGRRQRRGPGRRARVVEAPPPVPVRIDVWLDVACLFNTRAEAQKALRGGKVEVNGAPVKPNKLLKVGDELRITRSGARRQLVTVLALE